MCLELWGQFRVAAFVMLAVMLAQILIFVLWPPPITVEGFFELFANNKFLGLLSLDLLYILNNTLLILFYLGVYFTLRHQNQSAMLIGLILGITGIGAYYASTVAFEMLSLSNQFLLAQSETHKQLLLAAGQTFLEVYKGTAFDIYYVLNAAALLLFSVVMLRSRVFSRTTAIFGIVAGILMLIPSTAGEIGLVFSLASLVPWGVFSVLVALRLMRLD